jgi:hypothetical protein
VVTASDVTVAVSKLDPHSSSDNQKSDVSLNEAEGSLPLLDSVLSSLNAARCFASSEVLILTLNVSLEIPKGVVYSRPAD